MKNIRPFNEDELLKVLTNGEHADYDDIGESVLFPLMVHYNKNSIANFFSLAHIDTIKGSYITMDTKIEKVIFIHFNDKVIKLKQCKEGLHYCHIGDFNIRDNNSSEYVNIYSNKPVKNHISFLSTIGTNKNEFSKRETAQDDAARPYKVVCDGHRMENSNHITREI